MILPFFRQYNYKCTKENSVRDGDTCPSTSNPLPTKLNLSGEEPVTAHGDDKF